LNRRAGSSSRIVSLFSTVLFFALPVFGVAEAQMLTVPETEALVRATYFEGMPEEDAARIGPAGAERLVGMLFDPEERRSHGRILLALGLCGSPDAMDAILDWVVAFDAAATRSGEIDRSAFKAWQALPYALGHLTRFDRRAVGHLEALMNAQAPSWTFRHHAGARLRDLARRSAATSLARTGLPEARRALDRADRDASDARFEEHLRGARARHAERAREVAR